MDGPAEQQPPGSLVTPPNLCGAALGQRQLMSQQHEGRARTESGSQEADSAPPEEEHVPARAVQRQNWLSVK